MMMTFLMNIHDLFLTLACFVINKCNKEINFDGAISS